MTRFPDARPLLRALRRIGEFRRPEPLVLVNGLAEQGESWFANRSALGRRYEVMVPELLAYSGPSLHRHLDSGGEVTVDYLSDRLATYLDEFAPPPPYHFVGSSLGGQVVLTYAARHPEKVGRVVLIAPSGIFGEERLPVVEGVRRGDYQSLVGSVFCHRRYVTGGLVDSMTRKFADRRWKTGVLRTLRGTMGHSVYGILSEVKCPCLFIWGADDQILLDVPGAIRAAMKVPSVRQMVLTRCGHAPQIERAGVVNAIIERFLKDRLGPIPPQFDAARFLRAKSMERPR